MSKDGKHDKHDKGNKGAKDKSPFKAGVAVGIGSAAIVAALLYARSHNTGKKKG